MQGDIIQNCPIVTPPAVIGEEFDADIRYYNVVVMSQSCDLKYEKLEFVLVCPVWKYSNFKDKNTFYGSEEGRKILEDGLAPAYHLLNKCEFGIFENEFLIVDFRTTHGIHVNLLSEIAIQEELRIRLLPPYREQLSQSFAKFFMRVGLPIDIEGFC